MCSGRWRDPVGISINKEPTLLAAELGPAVWGAQRAGALNSVQQTTITNYYLVVPLLVRSDEMDTQPAFEDGVNVNKLRELSLEFGCGAVFYTSFIVHFVIALVIFASRTRRCVLPPRSATGPQERRLGPFLCLQQRRAKVTSSWRAACARTRTPMQIG